MASKTSTAADERPSRCNTILIVEDDPDIRESLRQVLELEGYNATCAANGRDALKQLEASAKPCLILLDLMMPVMNGWEFMSVARSDVALASIPVVVVSAAGDKATSAPGKPFIKKPIDVPLLLQVVRAYCD